MELELGLKITKVVDDFTSANLLISQNRGGPLFLSSQTETMFILTAHLNGYMRKNIKIDINEDGTKITIRGEKPVREMVMVGWKVVKNDIEMKGFRKSFKIPNGVVLDKIKAKFKDDESILTISIPKIEKGIVSEGIEELKDGEVLEGDSQSSESTDEANERERLIQENQETEDTEVKVYENGEVIEQKESDKGFPIEENRLIDENQRGENAKGEERKETEDQNKCDCKEEDKFEVKETCMQENQESEAKEVPEYGNGGVVEQKESEKDSLAEENRFIDEDQRDENGKGEEEEKEIEDGNIFDHKEDDKVEAKETFMLENQESKAKEVKLENGNGEVNEQKEIEKASLVEESMFIDTNPRYENRKGKGKEKEIEDENKCDHREDDKAETSHVSELVDQESQNEDGSMHVNEFGEDNVREDNSPPRIEENSSQERSKLCVPIVVGSALIVSFIVFVFHFIRSKNQTSKRRN